MGIKDEDLGFFAPERRPIYGSENSGLVIQHNNLGLFARSEVSRRAHFGPSRDQNFFIAINPEGSDPAQNLYTNRNPEAQDSTQTCALARVHATRP